LDRKNNKDRVPVRKDRKKNKDCALARRYRKKSKDCDMISIDRKINGLCDMASLDRKDKKGTVLWSGEVGRKTKTEMARRDRKKTKTVLWPRET
ncbi:hypothetical protein ACJMK2_039150, partial [Sinanodonta woodiana]